MDDIKNNYCDFIDRSDYYLVSVIQDSKKVWGILDRFLEEIIPCQYEEIESYDYDHFKVKKEGLCGIIDRWGGIHIPCQYDEIDECSAFDNGYVRVKKDNLC